MQGVHHSDSQYQPTQGHSAASPLQPDLPGVFFEPAPARLVLTNMTSLPPLVCIVLKVLPQLALALLLPSLSWAAVSGSSANLNGSLNQTNNNLLDFLSNDIATFCMLIGGILAAVTHVFNGGMGTKFFLSVFGCGVVAMAFPTVLSLTRGLANSVGH